MTQNTQTASGILIVKNVLLRLKFRISEIGYGGLAKRMIQRTISKVVLLYNSFEGRYYDYLNGTDTIGVIPISQLDVDAESAAQGTGYQGMNAWTFRSILRSMRFPKESTFVDIGSGKGKLLFLAAEYGFRRIVGIELSRQLYETSLQNLSIYQTRSGRSTAGIEIVQSNVLEYAFTDDENIFCFFNPFNDVIMKMVLDNIQASLQRRPRRAWIIYTSPQHASVIEAHSDFHPQREFKFFGASWTTIVFSNE
jgi:SAM-dependent methyltransferase